MFLTKTPNGSYLPTYPKDHEQSAKVKIGEEVKATRARNSRHHRKGMALLTMGFENQDKFTDFTIYRQVLIMRAGFVNWVDGTDGVKYPLPKSISFENMGQQEFEELYGALLSVISAELKMTSKGVQQQLENFM